MYKKPQKNKWHVGLERKIKPKQIFFDDKSGVGVKTHAVFFLESLMKKLLSVFFLAFCLSAGAQGIGTKGGSIDCGKWLSARKSETANYYESYLLGLVDGLALGRWVDIWSGKGGRVTREQFYYLSHPG